MTEQKTLKTGDAAIHYSIYGDGLPVVLLHGFGETSKVWKEQVDFLQQDYRLIVPDLPGSGLSGMTEDMSMEGMADTIHAIVEAEAPNLDADAGVRLIGHSMGGYITLAFAEKYPELLAGFGLFHSSAFPDNEEKKETRRKGISFIREHGALAFLKNTIPNLFSPVTKSEKPGMIDDFIDELDNFSPEALVSYYNAMMQRPDRTAVLKEAAVPVLFILGQHDNAIPFEDGLKQVNLPEISYIHVLRQSGHMGMLEETEKSNSILQDFLAAT